MFRASRAHATRGPAEIAGFMRLQRPLILASTSPRRADLLTQIGVPFTVRTAKVAEGPPAPDADIRAWVRETAARKARAVSGGDGIPIPALILAADTVVLLPSTEQRAAPLLDAHPVCVLGKPRDDDHAARMLAWLSGREHVVLTAFALLALPEQRLTLDALTTRVRFRPLSACDIADYLASGEPRDKAGAYGIQGRGAVFVAEITGDIIPSSVSRSPGSGKRWRPGEHDLADDYGVLGESSVMVASPSTCRAAVMVVGSI